MGLNYQVRCYHTPQKLWQFGHYSHHRLQSSKKWNLFRSWFGTFRLSKHEVICKSAKKRKPYNINKKRVQGTEAETLVKEGKGSNAKFNNFSHSHTCSFLRQIENRAAEAKREEIRFEQEALLDRKTAPARKQSEWKVSFAANQGWQGEEGLRGQQG